MKIIKRIFVISLFCLSLLVFPLVSQALNVQDIPNPRAGSREWVTDMADVLLPQTESQLNSMIGELEAENGTEIAVVTIPQTDAETNTRRFANKLFNHWGIGKAEEDNGILFLISKGDRRVRIETGYGIEAVLPDAKVGNILETYILPKLKEGNFDEGTLAGTKALIQALQTRSNITPSPIPPPQAVSPQPSTRPVSTNTSSYISWEHRFILWGMSLFAGIVAVISYRYLQFRINRPIYLEAGARSRLEGTDEYNLVKANMNCVRSFSFWAIFSIHLFLFSLTSKLFFLVPVEVFIPRIAIVILERKNRKSGVNNFFYGVKKAGNLKFVNLYKANKAEKLKLSSTSSLPFQVLSFLMLYSYIRTRIGTVDYGLEGFIVAISDSLVLGISGSFMISYFLIPKLYKKSPIHEQQTRQPMEEVDLDTLCSALTKAEIKAQKLGSVSFNGWRVIPHGDFHIRAHILDNQNFRKCPYCKELVVTQKEKVVESPSYSSEGKRLVTDECHCCDYRREKEETIPRRSRSSSSSSTSYGGGYSSGSSGSSSGGGDGGGGSFGGGSSGGGGADGGF